ncbi:hypothetical protein [Arthrobacter sp. RAF14]|uniref:hypothetical protein n=1 Tax=Arthrobacter sp. RAF14 TaxID=3233051 RepID=UPI003F90198D
MTANKETHFERERRFLVSNPSIVIGWPSVIITQAYLWIQDGYLSRVRLIQTEEPDGRLVDIDATYAIKGPRVGDERYEFESTLSDADVAREIIRRAPHVVTKRRHSVFENEAWDIDVFTGENEGLVIAEIEGDESRHVKIPQWCHKEITSLDEFNNESLAVYPWRKLKRDQS